MPLIIPSKGVSSYWNEYDKSETDLFMDSINYEKGSIANKSLFLDVKSISQNKLRDAGFSIKRDPSKCDVIIIEDVRKKARAYSHSNFYTFYKKDVDDFFQKLSSEEHLGYKYMLDTDLYKLIYKYNGDQQLFLNCEELFKSQNDDNVRMAMEFMSNADWSGNEIYLMELFNNYYNESSVIRYNDYKTSISFKGFLNSLNFDYQSRIFYNADSYRTFCMNDEHHQWVFNKYDEKFKRELDYLFKKYKVKVDELKYSIDHVSVEEIEEEEEED